MLAFFIILIITGHEVSSDDTEYCFANDEDPYIYMASKTVYEFVRGNTTYPPLFDCVPVQVWTLIRHGSRFPRMVEMPDMKNLPDIRDQILLNHYNGKGGLCEQDLINLKNWKLLPELFDITTDNLTLQGSDDMTLFAKRLKAGFPGLLSDNISQLSSNFKVKSSKAERASFSVDALLEGLFGDKNALQPEEIPSPDLLLRAYKECASWQKSLQDDSAFTRELNKFTDSLEIRNVVLSVSRRLGFDKVLPFNKVKLMYDMCRYEKSWNYTMLSPWCSVLSKEELRILEYREDMDYYYYCGPGRDINWKIGCSIVQDMFTHFRKLEDDNFSEQPKGIFYVSHSVTLITLLMRLGLINDSQPLTADNYASMSRRQWRTSLFDPFNSNFVAVFHKCNDPESINKVQFYLSENLVTVEGCEDGYCDWEFLKDRFGNETFNCDMNFCWSGASAPNLNVAFAYYFASFGLFYFSFLFSRST